MYLCIKYLIVTEILRNVDAVERNVDAVEKEELTTHKKYVMRKSWRVINAGIIKRRKRN